MVADVTPAGGKLRVGAPRQLFQQRQRSGASGFTMDDRAERFLLVVPPTLTSEASEAPADGDCELASTPDEEMRQ
jgi:hypothetical protein